MVVFAHGLYVDDFLWFVVPVAVSLWLLRWAERKARTRSEAEEDETAEPRSD